MGDDFFDRRKTKKKRTENVDANSEPLVKLGSTSLVRTSIISSSSELLPERLARSRKYARRATALSSTEEANREDLERKGDSSTACRSSSPENSNRKTDASRVRDVSLTPPPQLERDELLAKSQSAEMLKPVHYSGIKTSSSKEAPSINSQLELSQEDLTAQRKKGTEVDICVRTWHKDIWYGVNVCGKKVDDKLKTLMLLHFKLFSTQKIAKLMDVYVSLREADGKSAGPFVFEYKQVRLFRHATPQGLLMGETAEVDVFEETEYEQIVAWRSDLESLRAAHLKSLARQELEEFVDAWDGQKKKVTPLKKSNCASSVSVAPGCDFVKLKVRTNLGSETLYSISKDRKLRELLLAFERQAQAEMPANCRAALLFDCEKINYDKTAADYEMEDLDLIDAVWEPI